MLSSRGCLQLLLGWALLLGQPVGGTDDVAEAEAELSSSFEQAEGRDEPEDGMDEVAAAEPELPDEPEELDTSKEALDESYEDIWFLDPWEASEEKLEKMASLDRVLLERSRSYVTHSMRESCLSTMNKNPQGPFYKLLEDADLHTKNAIGSVSTFTLFVGMTNCTRAEGEESLSFGFELWQWREYLNNPSGPKCTLDPESPMKKCKIYIYTDGETGVSSVFHTDCDYFKMADDEPEIPME